ncbi:uncharacterized protein SCHCODRAFT_02606279 [Schizophyllum commune H4-8]|nr:uncharacterized protein SCHCODRAFT_02606279 [Schizophyllum commune H4-8]KAI5899839.1 hypothetical protein SCHCODRAFT_02606279 [Schizophyllum commune H4-8]
MHACHFCGKKTEDAKRCGRCQIIMYCSRDCQKTHWKASHKQNCNPHPSVDITGRTKPAPEPGSKAYHDLEMDLHLQKWIQLWLDALGRFAVMAFDLTNHGPERSTTHCLYISVRRRIPLPKEKIRHYYVTHASLETIADMDIRFPELGGIVNEPTDQNMLRYLIALGDQHNRLHRVRCITCKVDTIKWRADHSKKESSILAGIAVEVLVGSLEGLTPDVFST